MTVLPSVLLLSFTVAIGLFMGLRRLRGVPNTPVMIGVHFLLGAAVLEVLAAGLHSTPGGISAGGGFGTWTLLFAGLALFSGIAGALMRQQASPARRSLLAVHAAVAVTALVLALVLFAKLA